MNVIRIATRQSKLALWQANHVADQLRAIAPEITVRLVPITTRGDQILDRSLAKIGGKGLFVKELEEAMLRGEADLAVHSLKDVPPILPEGLGLHAVLPRENPKDALISRDNIGLNDLPQGAVIGTSSIRRETQLKRLRPDLQFKPLRGNVDTRLGKLAAGEFDAIILAAAGLHRLDWAHKITEYLPENLFLPAVGQGIIGIECRDDDVVLREILAKLHDEKTYFVALAERAFSQGLGGSCETPIAAHAVLNAQNGELHLRGRLLSLDGTHCLEVSGTAPAQDGVKLAQKLVAEILAQGGARLLGQ